MSLAVSGDRSRFLVAAVVLAVALSLAYGGFVGGVAASGADQAQADPPRLDSGERINDTAVELVFVDDSGVDGDSISESDFILSAGDIRGVSVAEVETNAVVTLRLAAPLDTNRLTVGVRNGSNIQDVDGNTIDTSGFVGVTVEGMDSVPPGVRRMEVPELASDQAEIRLVFDEPVETFHATLSGTRSLSLGPADFDRVRSGQYVLTYEPPEDGIYTFELVNATDRHGNSAALAQAASMEVRTRSVTASAGIDLSASDGLNITFDASQSTNAIEYIWDFDDGGTAAGKRVSHRFRPGNYTVTLRVIDEFGNVGQDQVELNLAPDGTAGFIRDGGAENESFVSVERSGTDRPTGAQVVVSQMQPGEPFVVRAANTTEPLVTTADFALEELTITPAESGGLGLGLEAAGAESDVLASARDASGRTPVGGFIARPTVAPDALTNVTVRFSVRTDRLETIGVGPQEVTLFRETEGTWEAQPTTVGSASADRINFESDVPGFSRFAVLAGDGEPDDPPDEDDSESSTNNSEDNSDTDNGSDTDDPDENTDPDPPENGTDGTNSTESDVSSDQLQVTNVTLSDQQVDPGQEFVVEAIVQNQGSEPADYVAALQIDGRTVKTQEVLRIPPDGATLPISFAHRINESGTVMVSVNGTNGTELTVGGSGGGGGLFGFLGFLGFLPLGLLRTLLIFVVAPIAVLGIVLKVVASYMGY